ncbi:LPS export ABC transporter permease LptF [Piscinibacter koreensis]|uniref:Lipopolysaccharide export system permease protein LptF n=1 Tax=Piscinibacter koreensis TaxID=2742824 RepID=A0A7Y6NS22_9BURK|nr:LPS export ABC transporter permease LptF [Schlegelella koreensis]NUZ08276.1 LPS export ABC transporter permease LptF [Schlegelella koreensis]
MLFDSSLRRELAQTFGATLVVILTIVLTIMFIRTLGQAAVGKVAAQDVVLLLGYVALGHLPTMLALSLFIAVVGTLGRMYRSSEMTIWFASGVSLARFVRPVLAMSAPVLVVIALLALFVWPWQNERSALLKERFEQRPDISRVAPGQFQTSGDGSRVFFYEGPAESVNAGRNVFVLAHGDDVESVTTANTGRIEVERDGRYIVLTRGQRNEQNTRTGDATLARFEDYRALTGERIPASATELPVRARASLDLVREPTPRNLGELAWRLGLLFGAFNLVLLGIGMSAANPRHASNWNLLFALLTFFVYYNLINLTTAWIASGKASLGVTLAAAHGSAFVIALLVLGWREHRNSRRPLLPRMHARARAGAAAGAA